MNKPVLRQVGQVLRSRATLEGAGVQMLLVSGRPLNEPVAWGGPIVMNTQDELDRTFEEYRQGTFIKRGREPEV